MGLQRVLGLGSYETAWTWLHKFRRAMVRPGRDRISGTVEVDEIYIGGVKKGKRGRGADGKTMVLIAAQEDGRRIGRIRLQRVSDASEACLIPAVKMCVEPGSLVRTDGWTGYSSLSSNNYVHRVVRKNADVGDNLLPLVNRVASLLKRWLIGTHQGAVRASHLDYYLDEYTFRFNRRTSKSRKALLSTSSTGGRDKPSTGSPNPRRKPKRGRPQHVGVRETSGYPKYYIPTRYPNGLPDLTPGQVYTKRVLPQA